MIYNKNTAIKIAQYLLEKKAVQLNPENLFTWSSGMKSPIYCDNRVTLSYPNVRNYIKESFLALLEDKFAHTTAISGVATAGIAHGALLADTTNLPFSYVRSKPKGHGMKNLIEGRIESGAKVVVVEDLISTGGSSIKAVEALKESNVEVLAVVAIFDYGFQKAITAFEEINCPFYTLSNFNSLMKYASDENLFSTTQIEYMLDWNKNVR